MFHLLAEPSNGDAESSAEFLRVDFHGSVIVCSRSSCARREAALVGFGLGPFLQTRFDASEESPRFVCTGRRTWRRRSPARAVFGVFRPHSASRVVWVVFDEELVQALVDDVAASPEQSHRGGELSGRGKRGKSVAQRSRRERAPGKEYVGKRRGKRANARPREKSGRSTGTGGS